MKKKSIIAIICTFIISLFVGGCGTSYHSEAGEMSELVGTYKLTRNIKRDSEDNEIDLMTTKGVMEYLVIGSDGHGYYAYKDNDTALRYDSIVIFYTYDDEETDLVEAIEINDGGSHDYNWTKRVGCGDEPKMGFNVNTHTLSWSILSEKKVNKLTHNIDYSSATYTKISSDVTTATMASELNTTIEALPKYELKNVIYPLVLDVTEESPNYDKYVYFIVDIDTINLTADIYYKEKSDGVAHVSNDVNINAEFNTPISSYYTGAVIELLGVEYSLNVNSYSVPGISFYHSEFNEEGNWVYSENLNASLSGLTIQELIDGYNSVE